MDHRKARLIKIIKEYAPHPEEGLGEELFLLVSKLTPMVNVDLLIKDEDNQTLLTWRHDAYYCGGWHLPGGIIRFREHFSDRLHAVAKEELGSDVDFVPSPIAINEIIHPTRRARGHSISLLFRCTLLSEPRYDLKFHYGDPQPGQWKWHSCCPENLLDVHDIYRPHI
jgi:colanic acid biosynthesis protein WcaH